MKLSSPTFDHNGPLSTDATCTGKGVSPTLRIQEVPTGAVSLALIMHDPDAPRGDFTHWLLWNIPPTTTEIPENAVEPTVPTGTNDYPTQTYGPACPPAGTGLHHYVFELYAVDTMLDVPAGSDRKTLQTALQGHILATTELVGTVTA